MSNFGSRTTLEANPDFKGSLGLRDSLIPRSYPSIKDVSLIFFLIKNSFYFIIVILFYYSDFLIV